MLKTMWVGDPDADFEDFMAESGALDPIAPQFFIPELLDAPQNPILETLKRRLDFKSGVEGLTNTKLAPLKPASITRLELESLTRRKTASWDTLCLPGATAVRSPFISEQDQQTFVSIRHHVTPRLRDPFIDIVHVSEDQLMQSLRSTVLGSSSTLHVWDQSRERLVLRGVHTGNEGILIIDGKEHSVGQSSIQSFLTIGTLLHRLDDFVLVLRKKYAAQGPTVNALSYELSTILRYLRNCLTTSSADTLSSLRMRFVPYYDALDALARLCGREESRAPSEYPVFDASPRIILANIYRQLDRHVEQHSLRLVQAVLAHMLTVVSRDLIEQTCHSVGYGKQLLSSYGHENLVASDQSLLIGISEDAGEFPHDDADDADSSDSGEDPTPLPPFFPPELIEGLDAARKSLKLLKAAQADHPILAEAETYPSIRWVWRDDQVFTAWNGTTVRTPDAKTNVLPTLVSDDTVDSALAAFHVFDLEPGTGTEHLTHDKSQVSLNYLEDFIASFPNTLPSLTPTLPQLCSLVFLPLVEHTSRLSNTLLSLLLSPTSHLHIPTHLQLLRSYLLLTSHGYKSRLMGALFSDSDDCKESPEVQLFLSPPNPTSKQSEAEDTRIWPVGLASTLLQRDTWPPVGTDLSFLLRTVIVDSLELRMDTDDSENQTYRSRRRIMEEAEFRLGFAIRDLPADTGREKWLNPLTIEALDFLYMDYKPPHPLDVIITPDVLSKYQRVFAFLLRLLRVQCASQAAFRMIRKDTLFPTLTPSNKLLLHCRFVMQSFVSAVSEYAYDTVIGGNFDPFIATLTPDIDPTAAGFSDIFALSRVHSTLLDDILSALLLRSGQRNVGDLLRQALEYVLEFAVLVGRLKRGGLKEYEAAPLLTDLHARFLAKMTVLVKVLTGLSEKGRLTRSTVDVLALKQPLRGVQCLHDLLVRLDLGDWWQKN
ncbi:Spindle pole body component [Pleurotus pulmonarius]